MGTAEKLAQRVTAATEKLARLKARQLLREMRAEHRERNRSRRELLLRRTSLGDALIDAGLGDWSAEEIRGMVFHVIDELGTAPTVRLGFRKRAQSKVSARGPPLPSEEAG